MIFNSILGETFTLTTYLICLVCSLLCGFMTALANSYKTHISKSFFISLILLPMIVQTVIMMVNGNVGTGVAVMGAFSLVRFRSLPGKASDISALFLVMCAGLSCASGYVGIALLFSAIVNGVMILLNSYVVGKRREFDLQITIPESLNFVHAFDDIFKKYFKKCHLVRTKTSNMGSLYKLTYKVELIDENLIQECIDQIRCRNGNLEILLSEAMDEGEL